MQPYPNNKMNDNKPKLTKKLLPIFAITLIVVSLILSIFVYKLAYRKGYHDANRETKILADGIEMNTAGLKNIQLENEILKNEADSALQERDISLNNLVNLRKRMEELSITNAQLKQTIKLYAKNLSVQGGIPLQVIGVKIEPLPEQAYEYRFDVLQLAPDGKTYTLYPKIDLLNSTSFVSIPIKPKTYEINGVARIRGRFTMPEGFNPQQLRLKLSAGNENIEQLYNWRLGKRKNDVPLSLAEVPHPDQRPITDK